MFFKNSWLERSLHTWKFQVHGTRDAANGKHSTIIFTEFLYLCRAMVQILKAIVSECLYIYPLCESGVFFSETYTISVHMKTSSS